MDGIPFELIKLRTMRQPAPGTDALKSDAVRLTGLGRFLRAASIDELPTLWNVIRGDMSLVGPRPLLMQYLPRYSAEQRRRHDVKPGITGWAQINGRNSIDWNRKFALDVWYVDHRSLWLDLTILARTLGKVVRSEGIGHGKEATMPEFMGEEPPRD
jgi:lipopolysaccharide/colanic/teichoic acid biosynthesis glycosyltransferase